MRHNKPLLTLVAMAALLLVLAAVAAGFGAMRLTLYDVWRSPGDGMLWQIWFHIRLPRVVLAMLVGTALALSGAVMQGLFRNPLADPGLLGISSGAALAVGLAVVLLWTLPPIIALYSSMAAAFVGSLVVTLVIFSLSSFSAGLARLLLAGISINALCGAATGVLSWLSNDQQLRQLSLWGMGSLGQAQWPTVAVSGVIGFVGLVVPHLVRMTLGADHRWLLPGAASAGAILL